MPLNARDQRIFEELTRVLEVDRRPDQLVPDVRREVIVGLLTTVVGMAALPVAAVTNAWWLGLVGFLIAVLATARVLTRVPLPTRQWLRDRGLLPRPAFVQRRSYEGTIEDRRTYIFPARLIVVVIAMGLPLLLLVAAPTRTEPPPRVQSVEQSPAPDESDRDGPRRP